MTPTMVLILLAGAAAGLGILLLVLIMDRRPVSGPAALARLDLDRQRFRRDAILSVDDRYTGEAMRLRQLGASVRESIEARGLSVPTSIRADLAMTGRSIESYIGTTIVVAAAGLLLPVLVAVLGGLFFGLGSTLLPLWSALLLAAVAGAMPTLFLKSAAAERRRDFRHVVGSFLDLVAMNLAGGRGVPEALETASAISTGWGMRLIRDCLQTARLQGVTPWAALGNLGTELQVDELRDLASALALVAEDGAKVRDSLSARADSMRQRELADTEGRAQARSQSMLVAQLLLCVGFLIFLIYPAVARVMGGL